MLLKDIATLSFKSSRVTPLYFVGIGKICSVPKSSDDNNWSVIASSFDVLIASFIVSYFGYSNCCTDSNHIAVKHID